MRLFRGPCHYGRELLPDLPFGWRELFTRGISWTQRKLGGMTQLLFGIRGKRWDSDPKYARLVTPAWTRPLPEDTPPAANTIEGGYYW